ncbi:hypothetical protein C4553_02025 [Candidatus Parcubacteria bacterium]|nr:MAG: hypothetical protein C4553_02025 [Candidatus Parcubacteria bacterium]
MVLLVALGGGFILFLSFSFLITNELRISLAALDSLRAYYAAEAGLEDTLLRLQPTYVVPPASYSLQVGSSSVVVSVGPVVGGTRVIIADGNSLGRIRRVSVNATTVTTNASFFYGAQVGEGGIKLGNGSQVLGNVFSNGDIIGNGAGTSNIGGTAIASGTHKIEDIAVGTDAYASDLIDCDITGTAFYVATKVNCPAGSTQVLSQPVSFIPLPISNQQITDWQNEAAAGGTLNGYNLGNNQTASIGPKKINGDMTLGNNTILTLTGTVWVTGTINFGNSVTIKLDSGYTTLSGILMVDGPVSTGNTAVLQGTGQVGSYLMLLDTASGSAISLGNSAAGAIFYAGNGKISVGNGLTLKEITAYEIDIANNASITYESGLANVSFSSGPGGRWTAATWQEIQ